jgi:hypothetical protein
LAAIIDVFMKRIRRFADGHGNAVVFGIACCLIALALTIAVAAAS